MGSAWVDGDDQSEKRRNREWILGRLTDPAYDIDNVGTVTVDAKAVDGTSVDGTGATRYVVPASGVAVAIVHRITICNIDSVANHAAVYLIEQGAGAGGAQIIFNDSAVQPGETVILEGPWFLEANDSIWSYSSTATVTDLAIRADITEYAAPVAGVTLAVDDGTAVTTVHTAVYTCPASNVRHATVLAITVCCYATAQTVGIEIRPNGAGWAPAQYVFAGVLNTHETLILGGFVLEPGDAIYASSSADNAVSVRVSAVEFAS